MSKFICIVSLFLIFVGCRPADKSRRDISLNGVWEIAKSSSVTQLPKTFTAKIQVPGLVDMAEPKIDVQDTAYKSSVYWYKRIFTVDDINAPIIQLKINKAAYHTWVFINGILAGENVYSFTPSLFDLKPFLNSKSKENELLIAVGCRNDLPDTVTNGWDFEKTKYTPGIYDNVKLIVSGFPFIVNVQTVPNINGGELRVVAEVQTKEGGNNCEISYIVRETSSNKVVAEGAVNQGQKNAFQKLDFIVKIPDCKLWSPETPFMYDLELSTSGDNTRNRFGMRTFETSKDSGVFLLNGKPYYLRGTNVCIFRFFEDPDRNSLPWDSKWTTLLHNRFKEMHWNSIRYCIGFPPERWYEIADSVGFLIQDEFPVWTGGKGGFKKLLKDITSRQLAEEYRQWMRERWNHPCVAVWDAQNESVNDTTTKAIQKVRELDLSKRPWDNGWAAPATNRDVLEAHPYLFSRYRKQLPTADGYLNELLASPLVPGNDPNERTPLPEGKRYDNRVVILNEYGWIWLNRNGTTTTLTDKVYENVFPEADTPEKRLEVYAKNLGILTEFWRAHRNAAAVMHFCGLGYSRPEHPRGQTSDNFTDINNLTYEPHFFQYVKPSFSPVGLMLEFWEKSVQQGQKLLVPVHLINDTYDNVEDLVKLKLYIGGELVVSQSASYKLSSLGKKLSKFL